MYTWLCIDSQLIASYSLVRRPPLTYVSQNRCEKECEGRPAYKTIFLSLVYSTYDFVIIILLQLLSSDVLPPCWGHFVEWAACWHSCGCVSWGPSVGCYGDKRRGLRPRPFLHRIGTVRGKGTASGRVGTLLSRFLSRWFPRILKRYKEVLPSHTHQTDLQCNPTNQMMRKQTFSGSCSR